jgi:hypothetical protein
VLAWPGGQVLVVAAGLVIIGVGVASVVKGVKQSFQRGDQHVIDVSSVSKGVARMGQVGYVAKGAALGVVGGLLSYATLTFDPQKAQGLDGALQTILANRSEDSCSGRDRRASTSTPASTTRPARAHVALGGGCAGPRSAFP